MDSKTTADLHANPQNPRTMSKHDADSLLNSMEKFGDLSSVVFNRRTDRLIGGHQRLNTMNRIPGEKPVQITQRFDPATDDGTVALGYIVFNKKPFPYREVDWPEEKEMAANIAANRIQGEFDLDLLAEMNYHIQQIDASLLLDTGQTQQEIDKLINMVAGEPEIELPDGDKPGFKTVTFTLADDQADVVAQAMAIAKDKFDFAGTGNDNSNGNAIYFVARAFVDSQAAVIVE